MKKTINLSESKLPVARAVEAVKHQVKKYIKRERNKALPEGVDFWDFDCRFGADQENSAAVQIADINKCLSTAELTPEVPFYLEILSKPGVRAEKPTE